MSEDYDLNLNDLLGQGSFGIVYGGICRETNKKVAIKKVVMQGLEKTKKSYYEIEIAIL